MRLAGSSTGLKEEDSDLSEVEVDEVLGLVGNIRPEVASNDTVPGRSVFLVKLLFDVRCDIFLDRVLFHCLCRYVNRILLHVYLPSAIPTFRHVRMLDHSFSVCHPSRNEL